MERPCCPFLALNGMQGYRTLQVVCEVRERYRGWKDPNVEGSLLYSHALALFCSALVTSFILAAGRGVGMLLHLPRARGDVQQG